MTVNLSKGGNVSLTKEAPAMTKAKIGLGWDARSTDGADFDLDASAFMLGEDGKVLGDTSFIFFNHKESPCGSLIHLGDNRTGEGDGDDEALTLEFPKVPAEVKKILIGVTIHEAEVNKLNFGQVSNAFIRVVDESNDKEITRYDLSEDASIETAMLFGELYRNGDDWKFKAIGQGYEEGLKAMAASVGVSV